MTRSGAQYLAEVSSTTMWTVLVVFPLLVLTRHSQFPVKPGWMLEMVRALIERTVQVVSVEPLTCLKLSYRSHAEGFTLR